MIHTKSKKESDRQTNWVTLLSLLELLIAAKNNDMEIFKHFRETYLHPHLSLEFNTFTLIILWPCFYVHSKNCEHFKHTHQTALYVYRCGLIKTKMMRQFSLKTLKFLLRVTSHHIGPKVWISYQFWKIIPTWQHWGWKLFWAAHFISLSFLTPNFIFLFISYIIGSNIIFFTLNFPQNVPYPLCPQDFTRNEYSLMD